MNVRWLLISAAIVSGVLVAPEARAGCLTDQRLVPPLTGVMIYKEAGFDVLNDNFGDYGSLFYDAQDPQCFGKAAERLQQKLQAELANANGFSGFLGGGDVYLTMATALILGGRGLAIAPDLRKDLDDLVQRVILRYNFLRPPQDVCDSSSNNNCMDDYSAAAAAYGWITAYQVQSGRDPGNALSRAHQNIKASFSTTESVCVHYFSFGSCTTCTPFSDNDPWSVLSLLSDLTAGRAEIVSFNRGENPSYGIGLLTGVSAAFTGLSVAGSQYAYGPSMLDRLVVQGLFRQGQRRTFQGATSACAATFTSECYEHPTCAPTRACGEPIGGSAYTPGMYPVRDFVVRYFGTDAVLPAPSYQFNDFCANPFATGNSFFSDGRKAVYGDLSWKWPFQNAMPTLAGLRDRTPPQVWVDVPGHVQSVSGTTNFFGWAIDAESSVSLSFNIDSRPLYGIAYGGSRQDVCATLHITKDPNCSVGWGGLIDTRNYANGQHVLGVTATDQSGNSATFSRVFFVDNLLPPPGVCRANPPVGPFNANAFNAGYLDYLCGYYKNYYGYDPYGYCAQSVSLASAAGMSTTATGTCSGGPIYNYYAGLYHYYCRYYEHYGYGWDYGSYCYWSNYYATIGGCTGCGQSAPTPPPCEGTVRTIWIQPQWRAGFGPPNSLILAGSSSFTGSCGPGGVDLYWRVPRGTWIRDPYSAPPGSDGIWYNSIEDVDMFGVYEIYVQYKNGPASYCTYDGRNDIVWCS